MVNLKQESSCCDTENNASAEQIIKREFYADGNLKRETPFKNNRKSGVEKFYFANQNLQAEIPYVDGKREGVEKHYYENGILLAELPHKNGLKHGTMRYYEPNGKLRQENFFENGVSNKFIAYVEQYHGLPLMEALWRHEFTAAKEMIENGADVNAPYNSAGWTPFLWICQEFGQGEEFYYYLQHGANIKYTANDGTTPLHILAGKMNYRDLSELSALGCDFNAQDATGNTPLMLAVCSWELSWGAVTVPAEFFRYTDTALKNNNGQTVFDIIKEKWQENPERFYEMKIFDEKQNALAAQICQYIDNENIQRIKQTLAAGVELDHPMDKNGETPFLYACRRCKNLPILQMLLAVCPNVNMRNAGNQTALHIMVKYQKFAAGIELLLQSGINADLRDDDWQTALMILLRDKKILQRWDEYQLLVSATDLILINSRGQTVLDYAEANPAFKDKKLLQELTTMYKKQQTEKQKK